MAQTFLKTKNIVVNLARVDFAQIARVYATLRIANFTNDVDAIEKMEVRKKLKSFSFSDRFGKKSYVAFGRNQELHQKKEGIV